jgi:fermentation-respiration switch protein FrsA (DUF1100 family)
MAVDSRPHWYARAEPNVYFEDSAIDSIDRLQAPIMILHGTNDPNVTMLQSVMPIDQLQEGQAIRVGAAPWRVAFLHEEAQLGGRVHGDGTVR